MKESALRDLIAQKISQLKPGLTLLQKEQYIPGEHGTKSFIDLYARDEKGRHVLIELKRSNTAAQQICRTSQAALWRKGFRDIRDHCFHRMGRAASPLFSFL